MREMKESGFKWIGEIPTSWTVIKSKYVIDQNDGGMWGNDPTNTENDKKVIRSTEQTIDGKWVIEDPAIRCLSGNNLSFYRISKNDLLITKSSGSPKHIGKTTLADGRFETEEFYYSNFIQRIKVKNVLPKFMWYIYNSRISREQFVFRQNSTSGIGNINSEDIANIYIPYPSTSEQQHIADYLDRKCGEIDSVMADLQEQIDKLEQYKRSVISETVTKGLNQKAPMKDSGISWVGMIPANWEVDKLKYHLHRTEQRNPGNKQVLSLYREYGVIPKDSRDDNHNVTSEDTSKYKYVVPGDFVINKMKAWQGSVGVSNYEGIVSPAYYVYKFTDDRFNKRYFHYLLRGCYKDEFRRLSGGIREGQWDLSSFALDNTYIILPTKLEQEEIAKYLDNKCAEIESIIADKKQQLEVVENYKKSLIYEYVTGKKEVVDE